jgi:hypothetical protein
MTRTLLLAALILQFFLPAAHAANWKKYPGEFAGNRSDCIDFASIGTDANGRTYFRRYVIDNDKACNGPNKYNVIEHIAVSCTAVLAAGANRDGFPVKYHFKDTIGRARWQEGRNASRQFSRVMQYVCNNRK